MKKVLLLVSLASGALPARELQAQSCMAADTSSVRIIATIRRLVTGTTGAAQSRAMLHLPSLAASQVTLVTDEASCLRARQAQDSLVHATNPRSPSVIPARALYVVKLGTYNALVDPGPRTEGNVMLGFFDPSWVYLGSIPVYIGFPWPLKEWGGMKTHTEGNSDPGPYVVVGGLIDGLALGGAAATPAARCYECGGVGPGFT